MLVDIGKHISYEKDLIENFNFLAKIKHVTLLPVVLDNDLYLYCCLRSRPIYPNVVC